MSKKNNGLSPISNFINSVFDGISKNTADRMIRKAAEAGLEEREIEKKKQIEREKKELEDLIGKKYADMDIDSNMIDTDKVAILLLYLETDYDVDFDTISGWEQNEAIEFIHDIKEFEEDGNLQELVDELSNSSRREYSRAVEKLTEIN